MKKTALTVLNNPMLVIVVCLLIAGAIGAAAYKMNNAPSTEQFAKAGPGSISNVGGSVASSSVHLLTLGFLTSGRIQNVLVRVGDVVKKDAVVASLDPENTTGAVTQAKAAYAAANANYQKVLNGATGPTIDVARAAVSSAQSALTEVTSQQDTLVANARRKLYSDNLIAISNDTTRRDILPTITGAYNGTEEGQYSIFFQDVNDLYNRKRVAFTGIESGFADTDDVPQPFGTMGLSITFPTADYFPSDRWTVDIPNKSGINYASNLSAYQAALQTRNLAVASAQATLNQAEASLTSIVAVARPEDMDAAQAQVENAQGALQIAEAAYNNRIIQAPEDGTITAVYISPGQIATPNAPAIEVSGTEFTKEVALMIPNNTIINRNEHTYVLVKTAGGTEEREITVGISDGFNTEVTAGLTAGDEVAIQ